MRQACPIEPSYTPSPKPIVFPFPTAVPINSLPPPPVENMETHPLYQGAWTTYLPPKWQERLQQTGEPPYISSIIVAADGSLWFSTTGGAVSSGVGAYHFNGKTWTHYTKENGSGFDEISSSMVTPDGAIWFGSFCCGVSRFDGNTWTTYTTTNGLASNDIRSMGVTQNGDLWFGTSDKGISRYAGKGWLTYTSNSGLWGDYVGGIFSLPDGSLLFSSSDGSRAKLNRVDGSHWTVYSTPMTDSGKYTVDLKAALNGNLWFASEYLGVYRLSESGWTNFTIKDGLANDQMYSLAAARDGSAWFGTAGGVSRFDGKTWTTFKLEGDTGNNGIGSIVEATDGSIWVGYYGGIAHYIPPISP